ncbi:hypothetical protein WJX72_002282 [[Myrmecia] bisecta]|uniref:peptidylprolyl isomerase n=1 Tax=[Myrmecia] bisecta TaxID=41462 RepID=A0AAW1Q303_9CHLO
MPGARLLAGCSWLSPSHTLSSRRDSCLGSRLSLFRRRALTQKPGSDVSWSQSVDEVDILMAVPADLQRRDVTWEVHPSRLKLQAAGEVLLEGDFGQEKVDLDGCFWVLEDAAQGRVVHITLAKQTSGYESWTGLLHSDIPPPPDLTVTKHAFLEFGAGGSNLGRVLLGLYGRHTPRTAANFAALCTGDKGIGLCGRPLHYGGCPVHRIIPGFMVQAGDFTCGDGTGGESIYGGRFDDEALDIPHDSAGLLSMANSGPNSNGSQFFITLAPAPWLDGKHTVFGRVEAGMQVVRKLEELGTPAGPPRQPVTISACGLTTPEAFKKWRRQQNRTAMELEKTADAAAAIEATDMAKAALLGAAGRDAGGAEYMDPWSPADFDGVGQESPAEEQAVVIASEAGPPGSMEPEPRDAAEDVRESGQERHESVGSEVQLASRQHSPTRRRQTEQSGKAAPVRGARLQSQGCGYEQLVST